LEELKEQYGDRKVILGIDRLDYMKGLPQKLQAFDLFLQQNKGWVDSVVLIQLAVPSRGAVPEYQRLKRQVHEMVGKINGKFSGINTAPPIVYLDQALDQKSLAALYRVADVALITSLRDGMNLVSYEYVACQGEVNKTDPEGEPKYGVLVLSEFAGAAQSLGAGSLRINPWNVEETANAIAEALTMRREERRAYFEYADNYVKNHTSKHWAETFIDTLVEACSESEEVVASVPPVLPFEDFLQAFSQAPKRILVFDLLGCLVPQTGAGVSLRDPSLMIGTMPKPVMHALEALARCDKTIVIIITGLGMEQVVRTPLGSLPIILAAENGCVYRNQIGQTNSEWIRVGEEEDPTDREEWQKTTRENMEYFYERTPGSTLDQSDYALTWHFENVQLDFGAAQARELMIHLAAASLNAGKYEVVMGARYVQVRPRSCSPKECLQKILEREIKHKMQPDFAACFLNYPFRDEETFQAVEDLVEGRDNQPSPAQGRASPIEPAGSRTPNDSPRSSRSGASTIGTPPWSPTSAPRPGPMDMPPDYHWDFKTPLVPFPMLAPSVDGGLFDMDDIPDRRVFSVTVGTRVSKASYSLPNAYQIQQLLRSMANRLASSQGVGRSISTPVTTARVPIFRPLPRTFGNDE